MHLKYNVLNDSTLAKVFTTHKKNACTKNVEFTALLFMISSILQWKHIRKLANIPPVSCSIRTKYLKCHFNCSFDLLYKLAVVCLSCYPITIYYLPINNCAVLPFLYYIREKRMEFKAFEHKKAHNFKLAPINFITIVLTLKWNEELCYRIFSATNFICTIFDVWLPCMGAVQC